MLKVIKDITGITAKEEKAKRELAEKEEKKRIAAERRAEKKAKKEADKKAMEDFLASPKKRATDAGEPYIAVVDVSIDKEDPGQGAFELDWNDTFVARLVKAGYPGKTDADIVDNWFKDVCRNVVLETYEQEIADPEKRR